MCHADVAHLRLSDAMHAATVDGLHNQVASRHKCPRCPPFANQSTSSIAVTIAPAASPVEEPTPEDEMAPADASNPHAASRVLRCLAQKAHSRPCAPAENEADACEEQAMAIRYTETLGTVYTMAIQHDNQEEQTSEDVTVRKILFLNHKPAAVDFSTESTHNHQQAERRRTFRP
jgi:hypothetical protein